MTIHGVPTPECDRIAAVANESNAIGQYHEWLFTQMESWMSVRGGERTRELAAEMFRAFNVRAMLAKYFDIDEAEADRERSAVLAALAQLEG